MATIRIAESVRPARSKTTGDVSSTGVAGGVFPMRSLSSHSMERRSLRGRRLSFDRHSTRSGRIEEPQDEDSGLRRATDYKKKQVRLELAYIFSYSLTQLGFYREDAVIPRISIYRCDIW